MGKKNMSSAVNPRHYSDMEISPLEYILKNDIPWREANAIKYISRYKKKNGLEDLKKARWYLNNLINEMEMEQCIAQKKQ